MKRIIYLFLLFVLFGTSQVVSQVTIGSSEKPDDSAILDLKQNDDGTSNKGLLIPRVKLVETTDPSPLSSFVEGLIVYNVESGNDVEHGFYYCDGNQWVLLKPSDDITFPAEPWLVAGTDEQATSVSEKIYHIGEVVIGRSGETNPQAELEVYSDSRGFLMPRLSEKQRDAIPTPITESLMIWNIDESCYNFYAQGKWRSMCGDIETQENVAVVGCDDIEIVGEYKVGKPLDDSNYINVTVQVSGPCNLRLEGETLDGFYFQRTGRVLTSGTFTFKIPGYGTPRKVGTDIEVTVNAYNNSKLVLNDCKQTVDVTEGSAQFSTITLESVDPLTKGQVSAGKLIKVKVNVTTAGTFSFYTDAKNGVQYSSTNQELSTGLQEVTLYSNGGIPIASGPVDYTVSGNGGTGTLVVTVPVNSVDAEAAAYCDQVRVVGNYINTYATTTSNYIECTVYFKTTGSWTGTATTSNNDFRFDGSGNISKTGTQIIRLYATGIPTILGDRQFDIDVNGVKCTAKVSVLIPPRNVLLLGDLSSAINDALLDLTNFGPNGKSQISNINLIEPKTQNPNAATLKALIDDNKIHIILAGWHFKPNEETSQVVANLIDDDGFFFQVQGQSLQSYMPYILKKAYGADVKFTSNGYPIRAAQFPSTTGTPMGDAILNGVFGDCGNKYFRVDDDASWMGIVPDNDPLASFIQLPLYSGNAARNLFTYADGFFMIPDWGALSGKTDGSYGTFKPIGYGTAPLTNYYVWPYGATQSTRTTIAGADIMNWILFGNVMDYIFKNTKQE